MKIIVVGNKLGRFYKDDMMLNELAVIKYFLLKSTRQA